MEIFETIQLCANKWFIELFVSDWNTWNHLIMCKQNELGLILKYYQQNHIFNIYV